LSFGARQSVSCCALFLFFLRFSTRIQKTRFHSGTAQNNAFQRAPTSNRFSAEQLLIFTFHRPAFVQFSRHFPQKSARWRAKKQSEGALTFFLGGALARRLFAHQNERSLVKASSP